MRILRWLLLFFPLAILAEVLHWGALAVFITSALAIVPLCSPYMSANAWVGCACVKLGAPAVCVRGPVECGAAGGVCLAPCDYVASKKVKHHRHHKKAKAKKEMKKEIKKEDKKPMTKEDKKK